MSSTKPGSASKTRVLTHVASDGQARMVNVGEKPITNRSATAEGFVRISLELARAIRANAVKKGSVLEVARLAGIMAAKKTDELIPLCHTLPLDAIDIHAVLERSANGHRVRITATARTQSRTGVEMEALVAVTLACLTVIDMGKAIDKTMTIEDVRVLEKQGGRSGHYLAADLPRRNARRSR